MAEQVLESKLRKVKDRVYAALEKGEIEQGVYSKLIYNLLDAENVFVDAPGVLGTKNNIQRPYLTGVVEETLRSKLGLDTPWGLRTRYIARKDVPLAETTKKDLKDFEELKESAKSYVQENVAGKVVTKTSFSDTIRSYLLFYKWPFDPRPSLIDETVGRLSVILADELKIEPKEDNYTISGYDKEMFDRVLEKI